ncbi:hypothetical protein BDV96DRAFT_594616 [Lophiotrema nucula]|uniref:Uncharacterized protein n=1 Tax=Lophiotrema nucula TaxID=690887 RepID=A0A6A5ZQJ7_9PLEO|nr:hypothetical protein BDV96DRAFT_594616 [Lophiotrema nucula]
MCRPGGADCFGSAALASGKHAMKLDVTCFSDSGVGERSCLRGEGSGFWGRGGSSSASGCCIGLQWSSDGSRILKEVVLYLGAERLETVLTLPAFCQYIPNTSRPWFVQIIGIASTSLSTCSIRFRSRSYCPKNRATMGNRLSTPIHRLSFALPGNALLLHER